MKILYLTHNVSEYKSALYQQDVISFLKKSHEIYLYGPGFPDYNKSDLIKKILTKCNFQPDFICFGHAWLLESPDRSLHRHPNLALENINLPKVMILNKEYAYLNEKLNFIKKNNIDLVFTHHHKTDYYNKKTGKRFIFWPFAVNHYNFKDYGEEKKWDLVFTGILINPNPSIPQSDIRIRIQKKLFYSIKQLKLILKPKYWNYSILWRARPTNKIAYKLNAILHREKTLSSKEYFKVMNRSRICLNTLSPINLVGTRYFEAMASKCMVLCQEASVYKGLFEPGKHCITFKNDLSDFDGKLSYYTKNNDERLKIIGQAYNHVLENHTWEKRIEQFIKTIEDFIF